MKILKYQNYLELIKASEETTMFRHLWVRENGQEKDILRGGELSCAYFVSSVLKIFDLIGNPHATVKSTIADMLNSGWWETEKLTPGNVLAWEEKEYKNGEKHSHIGFYLGENKAISNSTKLKIPQIHHYTYHNQRKITQILTHPSIN